MSRSYRKNVILTDQGNKKAGKKFANRKVRRSVEDPDFTCSLGDYKKLYESYNISDYAFGYKSWENYYFYNRKFCKSDEECWANYKRKWLSK